MLDTALDALARRDAAAALAAARSAVEAEPERAEAHHALGAALQLSGQLDAAAQAYDRAVELAPQQAVYHIARAALALGNRDLESARSAIDQAVAHDPNALAAYVMSAHMALSQGRHDEAEAQLKLARRINAEHPLTLTLEGNLLLAQGRNEEAQRVLHRAAERAPEEPLVLSSLAIAYLATDNAAFAAQALRRALAAQPEALNLRWMLIHTLRRLGHHDDLPEQLGAVLSRMPDSWRARLMLGDTHLRLGDVDGALAAYREVLLQGTAPAPFTAAVVGVLIERGLWDQTRALLDELLAARPQDDLLWQQRLMVVEADGNARAVHIERWQQALPDSARARAARAMMLEQAGDMAGAEAAADEALARDATLHDAQAIKARAALLRDPKAALPHVEALLAHARDPGAIAAARSLQGFVFDRLGRHAEAVRAWSEAAAASPVELPPPRPPVDGATGDDGVQPKLLWGPPGSRVGRIVALLRSVPDLHVLDDRFGSGARPDGLWPPRQDGSVADAGQWQGMLARRGFDSRHVIDWLPVYDPCVASALPHARIVAVIDDPRDLLLNWLAYGSPQVPPQQPDAAAAWLAQALDTAATLLEAADPRLARIGGEAIDSDADGVAERLRGQFALPSRPVASMLDAASRTPSGLPVAFPPGHWRHYRDALAEPFALLAPIAQRLGYPAD